jgi:hypothetical protein
MNIKKGLSRLFAVGLFLSAAYGFFTVNQDVISANSSYYVNTKHELRKEFEKPECREILEKNNVDTNPVLTSYSGGACFYTNNHWSTIQDGKRDKRGVITPEAAIEAISASQNESKWTTIFINISMSVITYVMLCLLALAIYYVYVWVKRGFTAK